MRSRIVLLLILLTAMWTMLIGRAAYLQLVPDVRLQSLQRKQFETVVTLNGRRGDVTDRNGHELAVSMAAFSVFADPKLVNELVEDPEWKKAQAKKAKKIARKFSTKIQAEEKPKMISRRKEVIQLLAAELKMPVKQVEEKLRGKKKRFVWLARHLGRDVKESIETQMKEKKLRGIGFVEESKRIYPNERLLSHVLGFVGENEGGLEGLELKYNKQLAAENKKINMRKDARGRPLLVAGQMFAEAPAGDDIQLTVDREIQFILEQELHQAVDKHEADSAVGIVLDAQTSEVLAMASSPAFDPNEHAKVASDRKRNRTVTDSFEPGSTMKTFVIAGALQNSVVNPNTRIDCEDGKMRVGKRIIREADSNHKFKMLTVSEILAVSSNVGTTKIAFKMGGDKVEESFRMFGFGDKSGIDLPGEVRGIVQPRPWKDHLLANISFGHGITATPLQIANAYAAIANGGWLRQPYIVKSIRNSETGEVEETKPKSLRRVLNDDVASKMRFILTNVTNEGGSGINARVPGFPVAGKTGTAQKVNPNGRGYIPGGYISSFAGFIPAHDPRFVIYIAVDRPRKGYYGSSVAAPVFSRVASFAVRKAGLAPILISQEDVVPKADLVNTPKSIPRSEASLQMQLASKAQFRGGPTLGKNLSKLLNKEKDSTGITNAAFVKSAEGNREVPELVGLTLREVMGRVTGSGVVLKIVGEGVVSRTEPAAGTHLSANELTVYLEKN